MKGQPIHQNLSTSFVDLSALVQHLRDMQFVGSVRVELSSYEAEIIFAPKNHVQAREYDKLIGRISQGEDALKRILTRSQEPFGRVSVVQADAKETVKHLKKAFVDDRIVDEARRTVFGNSDRLAAGVILGTTWLAYGSDDSKKVVELANELLASINRSFERSGISFEKAFYFACEFVSGDHVFLNPRTGVLRFDGSKISLEESIANDELFDGLIAAIHHVQNRLRESGRHKLLVSARNRIKEHIVSRRDEYARLSILRQVERIL